MARRRRNRQPVPQTTPSWKQLADRIEEGYNPTQEIHRRLKKPLPSADSPEYEYMQRCREFAGLQQKPIRYSGK